MTNENIGLEIYEYIVHRNTSYHYILFEEKGLKFILPFEAEIEELLRNG